jgi:hypothetical protein
VNFKKKDKAMKSLRKKFNRFGKICLVIGTALTTTPVAAQSLRPIESGQVSPVPQTSPSPSPSRPSVTGNQQIPLRAPVSPAIFNNLKAGAATKPGAPNANSVLRPTSSTPQPSTSDIQTSFVGLDRPSAANHGFQFVPPDPTVAKSPNRVLQATNSALRLFTTTGSAIQTLDLNTFFVNTPTANGILFDPKVYYDRNATNPRFYVVALQSNFSNTSTIWLAVSRRPDPGGLGGANWCYYSVNGVKDLATPNASFADYPSLGAGADSLLISVNNFTFATDSFTYAFIYAFNKTVASNNAGSCPRVQRFAFRPSNTLGDGSTFTLQPVQHYTSPTSSTGNPAYLLATIFGSSNQYRVMRVQNVNTCPRA